MTDTLKFTSDGRLALTDTEIQILQELLDAHDRGGFYMAYNAMTDSAEAALQSRISTFSDPTGGAALAANRLAQVETGGLPTYPGMYFLSQNIAQSALDFIKADIKVGAAGAIDDPTFFASAQKAWETANVLPYFPGNALYGAGLASSLIRSLVLSAAAIGGGGNPWTIAALTQAMKQFLLDASHVATPGAFNSAVASLIGQTLGKTDAEMLAAGYQKMEGITVTLH